VDNLTVTVSLIKEKDNDGDVAEEVEKKVLVRH